MSKPIYRLEISKTPDQLRESPYHQELGRKMCAAYIAQHQGIAPTTALKKITGPVGDLWLVVAEIAHQGCSEDSDSFVDRCMGEWSKLVM
jgi:hypothetical protein